MRSIGLQWLCLGGILLVGGCATSGAPEIRRAGIDPSELRPGDTAVITVEIEDDFDVIERVEGVILEDTSITFRLHDDGVPPDEEADDDIWTIQVDVPFNAPPGNFTFDVKAYDSEGQVVLARNEMGEAVPLSASFDLVITYPQQE